MGKSWERGFEVPPQLALLEDTGCIVQMPSYSQVHSSFQGLSHPTWPVMSAVQLEKSTRSRAGLVGPRWDSAGGWTAPKLDTQPSMAPETDGQLWTNSQACQLQCGGGRKPNKEGQKAREKKMKEQVSHFLFMFWPEWSICKLQL